MAFNKRSNQLRTVASSAMTSSLYAAADFFRVVRPRRFGRCRHHCRLVSGFCPSELKVAGPSMLGIGHPDRHALRRITLSKTHQPCRALPPARAGSFIDPKQLLVAGDRDSEKCSTTEVDGCPQIGPPWWKKGQFVPVPNVAVLVGCRWEASATARPDAQPFIFRPRGGTCLRPHVKGLMG